ncbi:MAG: transcriptional regulator [Bacteroidia bacterium]|nr:transcriptional regulator [Bacteroidia bacterium]
MDSPCFSTEEVRKEFPALNALSLNNTLARMVKNKMLIRLSRGLFYIIPLNQSANNFIPDWHLVAKYLLRNKNYYIGYYSALQIHKLITQPSLVEIVVTNVQIKPAITEIQGIRFQFVYHNQNRFFGEKEMWIDDFNKVKCSDLEKTLVDSFINPQYSQGMVEIAKAVYESRNKTNVSKMAEYFARSGSKVAARRYVFICDTLGISTDLHERILQNNLSGSFLRLDNSAPDQGKINMRYELKINRDLTTLKEAIHT